MNRESLAPQPPLIGELDLTTLGDKALRDVLCEQKLRWAIAKQIRDLRLSRGWSQAELAQRIHTKQPQVSWLEDPTQCWPTAHTLLKIAKVFDVALIIRFVATREFLAWIAELETSSRTCLGMSFQT